MQPIDSRRPGHALLEVYCPEDAEITINKQPTLSRGRYRVYRSPMPHPKQQRLYVLRATIQRRFKNADGKWTTVTLKTKPTSRTLVAGEEKTVVFSRPQFELRPKKPTKCSSTKKCPPSPQSEQQQTEQQQSLIQELREQKKSLRKRLKQLQEACDPATTVFAWERGDGNANVESHGRAAFTVDGDMDAAGGWFEAQGFDERLAMACRHTNQLTLEAVITPSRETTPGDPPKRIVTFSSSVSERNFTLGQTDNQLVFRLRTGGDATDENGRLLFGPENGATNIEPDKRDIQLTQLQLGKPVHVIITYDSKTGLSFYKDGMLRLTKAPIGDFSNWTTDHRLLFGDEHTRQRDWFGTISRVTILSRTVDEQEAKLRFRMWSDRVSEGS